MTIEKNNMEINKKSVEDFVKSAIELDYPLYLYETIPELYHYTSIDALYHIASEKLILAGHISQMNDRREITYGKELIKESILNYNKTSDSNFGFFKKYFTEELDKINSDKSIFVVSLSEESDMMSQWKMYGSDFSGCRISLDLKDHIHALKYGFQKEEGPSVFLGRVIYDKNLQYTQINNIIRKFDFHYKNSWRPAEGDGADIAYASMVNLFFDKFIATMKDPVWAPEREWRLILQIFNKNLNDNAQVALVSGRIKAHIPLGFIKPKHSDATLTNVMLGPLCRLSVDDIGLRLLLQKISEKITISQSNLPIK